MKILKLKPTNNRFKRLINDFGDEWVIRSAPRAMACFNDEIGICCSPLNNVNKLSNFKLSDLENE